MMTRSPNDGSYTGYSDNSPYANHYNSGNLGAGMPPGVGAAPKQFTPNDQKNLWDSISNIFKGWSMGNQENPADAAFPYLDQIEGKVSPYYKDYIDAGHQMLPELKNQYLSMMRDPSALMNRIGAGFQASPGYQYNVDQATAAANRAAAASGMLGTPAEQAALAKTVHGLADQDYGQYMDRGMSVFNRGLQGGEGINQMGYNASSSMADAIQKMLMAKAGLAYAGAANAAQQQGGEDDFFSSAFSKLGPMAMKFAMG